jgi:hypothetical protein
MGNVLFTRQRQTYMYSSVTPAQPYPFFITLRDSTKNVGRSVLDAAIRMPLHIYTLDASWGEVV